MCKVLLSTQCKRAIRASLWIKCVSGEQSSRILSLPPQTFQYCTHWQFECSIINRLQNHCQILIYNINDIKIYYSNILLLWAKIDRGSNPGWGEFSTSPSRLSLGPVQPPVQWILAVFPGREGGGKTAVARFDRLPSSSAEVKERVHISLHSIWAFMACITANFTFHLVPDILFRMTETYFLIKKNLAILHP